MSTVTLSFDNEDTKPTYPRTLTSGGALPDPVGDPRTPRPLTGTSVTGARSRSRTGRRRSRSCSPASCGDTCMTAAWTR